MPVIRHRKSVNGSYDRRNEILLGMGLLHTIKVIYRRVTPEKVRSSSFIRKLKAVLYKIIPIHDFIYDDDVYESFNEGSASRSVAAISETIIKDLKPVSVIDVGCGAGILLEALQSKGCQIFGLEYSSPAVKRCKDRGVDVRQFNLEKDSLKKKISFDVVVSMEVAEHLPERTSDRYLDLLVSLADIIVFTAAPPGQGGLDHVNEQPKSYWITRFKRRNYVLDEELTAQWADKWEKDGNVAVWYYKNLMIFRSESGMNQS